MGRTAPPLDDAALRALAIRYVARYATSSGKLEAYLKRKVRERGWSGDSPPALSALVTQCVDRGYVDDAVFARNRADGLARKGMGQSRIGLSLRAAGVPDSVARSALNDLSGDPLKTLLRAILFARRKRIGPYGTGGADPKVRERWMGQMIRAGHDGETTRTLLALDSEAAEVLAQQAQDYG